MRYEDPENYISVGDALEHVLENDWDVVVDQVHSHFAAEWLKTRSHVLDLLNLVSGYDRDLLRESVRRLPDPPRSLEPDLSPSRLFTVASQVSESLEGARSPYAGRYSVDDDPSWVVPLVEITRAFREFLFALSGPDPGWTARAAFGEPLKRLNVALAQGITFHVELVPDRKAIRFERTIHPTATALQAVFADWIGDYLTKYRDAITLAVCIECGRIFKRERRDNVYCSKTCQNRVAYKRKRMFEDGVLQLTDVDATVDSLRPGLCMQHVRFGLGLIEDVSFPHRRIRLRFDGPVQPGLSIPVPPGQTAQMVFEEVRTNHPLPSPVGWDELVTPTSLTMSVRFLSTVLTFSYGDLFTKEKEVPKFYSVADPRRLAELL